LELAAAARFRSESISAACCFFWASLQSLSALAWAPSRLLGSGLRVTVVAIRYIAIANGFGGGGFGVEAALGFLIGMGLGVSFTACSRGAFGFGAFFVNMLHGDFTGVFRGLHDFARQSRKRLLVFMLPAGERVGFVHLVNGFFVA